MQKGVQGKSAQGGRNERFALLFFWRPNRVYLGFLLGFH